MHIGTANFRMTIIMRTNENLVWSMREPCRAARGRSQGAEVDENDKCFDKDICQDQLVSFVQAVGGFGCEPQKPHNF